MDAAENKAPTDIRPRQTHAFWKRELEASEKMLETYHRQGVSINDRYLDERSESGRKDSIFRLNLFHSNTKTLQDLLFGQLPKVESSRRFADANDDVARVAAEIIERINNLDIQEHGETYDAVLKSCLQDRLLPGNGVARVLYEVETKDIETVDPISQELISQKVVVHEDAPVEYYHWQDVLWGWSRNFADIPWIAFRSYLSKDQVATRFGEKVKDQVTYKTQKVSDADEAESQPTMDAPWQKAEIWEIWDKEKRQVVWLNEGYKKLLDTKDDPLKLTGFYPCPPFLMANATTTLYKPTSDYHIAQDLYNEVDRLQTRISIITEAVRVIGLYNAGDEGNAAIARMFKEGNDNKLIPVDNWALFAESGGLQGQIDWFPLNDVVAALNQLIAIRDQTIALLQQITGTSDVMRGDLSNKYEGVGQSQLKAQYGSARIQAMQEQFAAFVGGLFQIRSEVICKHFDPETIQQRANMQFSSDAELVPQAIELLKQPKMAHIRIQVRPESVAMEDFARLRSERTEYLTALSTFMQSAAPMLQQQPNALPYLLKMLQWTMSGFKGSSEIEGVLDRAIEGAIQELQQAAGKPKEDPEAKKAQGEMQKIQAKGQADMALRQADAEADLRQLQGEHQAKMAEIQATHQARMTEIMAKSESDQIKEQTQLEANVAQTEATVHGEMVKDAFNSEIELAEAAEKSDMKIEEIAVQSANKIDEMIVSASVSRGTEEENDEELDSD